MTITPARTSNAREKRALVCSNEPTGECNPRSVGSVPKPLREKRDEMNSEATAYQTEQDARPAPNDPSTDRRVCITGTYPLTADILDGERDATAEIARRDVLSASELTAQARRIRDEAANRETSRSPTPGYVAQDPPTRRCWIEYERRRNALPDDLSSAEYDHHLAVIVAELGI